MRENKNGVCGSAEGKLAVPSSMLRIGQMSPFLYLHDFESMGNEAELWINIKWKLLNYLHAYGSFY